MIRIFLFNFFLLHSVYANQNHIAENNTAIYGKDDRVFVDKNSGPKINELSQSIGLIISKDVVEKKFFFSKISGQLLSDIDGVNLCQEEKFANHHSVNSCSGFLIGDDLVLSAGHCFMTPSDCDNKLVVFNVQTNNEIVTGFKVANKNIYECSEIVKNGLLTDGLQDFSIIRLKKKVKNRKPLKMRSSGTITLDDYVFMIGHPLGLPQVATNKALVNDISDPNTFKAPLDSFDGNSGSPVFNSKTFEVEGLLVLGQEDFIKDDLRPCNHYQKFDEGTKESPSLGGELITRIQAIGAFSKAKK